MPEQKLDLLQFSSGEVTQPRAAPAEVVRRQVRNSCAPGCALHHVPYGFGGDVVAPDGSASADSAKDEAGRYPRDLHPVIHRAFDPPRHWNRSDVFAISDQVGHNPVFLPDSGKDAGQDRGSEEEGQMVRRASRVGL
jgi:hypothetical protein